MRVFEWMNPPDLPDEQNRVSTEDFVKMVVDGAPALSADDRSAVFAMLPAVRVVA